MTKYIISIMLTFISLIIMAQPAAPPATPIDGGLGMLVAGGAALAIRRIVKKKP